MTICGYLKPAIVVITTAVEKMMLPLDPNFECDDADMGSELEAFCKCKGGQDGGCKHISAAMYSLEYLLNTEGKDSVTSGKCFWRRKPKLSIKPCKVKDKDF